MKAASASISMALAVERRVAAHGHGRLLGRPDVALARGRGHLHRRRPPPARGRSRTPSRIHAHARALDAHPAASGSCVRSTQLAVRERDRPPALGHRADPRVADAQHQLGRVHAHVAPALQRPGPAPAGHASGGRGRPSSLTAGPRAGSPSMAAAYPRARDRRSAHGALPQPVPADPGRRPRRAPRARPLPAWRYVVQRLAAPTGWPPTRCPCCWTATSATGPVFSVRILHSLNAFLLGPEANHHMLVSNAANFRWRDGGFGELEPLLGDGLLTIDGGYHRRARRIMLPAFHRERDRPGRRGDDRGGAGRAGAAGGRGR